MRTVNADAVFADDVLGVYAVADGVGSTDKSVAASAKAIYLAIKALPSHLAARQGQDDVDLVGLLEGIYCDYRAAFEPTIPSTTLSLLRLTGARLELVNAGDSPVFLIQDQAVSLLTRDHTLIDQGRLVTSFSQLKSQNGAEFLVNAFGPNRPRPVRYDPIDLTVPARLVVCSDGLLEVVTQEALGELSATAAEPADLAEALREAARAAAPRDNFSGVIIDLSSDGDGT